MTRLSHRLAGSIAAIALIGAVAACSPKSQDNAKAEAGLIDGNTGGDWTGYGNTYGEQHFSPLTEINAENVGKLGLAWSYDLPAGNPMSGPIAVNGVLYTATGYSVVRAFEPATGKLLWEKDLNGAENAGLKLREGWGIRGLAWWNGKVIVGVQDGRLVALDGKNGDEIWSAMTVGKEDLRFVTGAPRVFDGKVIIGHGGADSSATRGYVTTYDAETGKKLWRFYLAPGKPGTKDGEVSDPIMEEAAKTWTGEWWKHGGGATVWNTFTYDKQTDTVFLGTGNGAPWNQRVRSPEGGDNWFVCSVVALDAKTGKYKWHYQYNPGETWDYNASMDMQLADLTIDGKPRKVLMQAPKNGFFYVIDRTNGKLISAEPYTKVTWATGIDLETGRPKEVPDARYPDGKDFILAPGPNGSHTWLPSAFSPATSLMYMPIANMTWSYNDRGIDHKNWKFSGWNEVQTAVNVADKEILDSRLSAIDPVTHEVKWAVPTPGAWNGGVLATGGNLVFQGTSAGQFIAYDARDGKKLWSFDAKVPVLAPPISYSAGGKQYVTVLTGVGTSAGILSSKLAMRVNYRTQARRVLTFVLDGKAALPATPAAEFVYPDDPTFKPDAASAARGAQHYARCFVCHAAPGIAGGSAPELATSTIPQSAELFKQIVHGGALKANGMPQFEELSDQDLEDLRQYIRTGSADARKSGKNGPTGFKLK